VDMKPKQNFEMKESSATGRTSQKAALLWDESFLWGLMAYKALKNAGLPFDLVRSEDIRRGCLKEYGMLFVPGGWASNKIKALGDAGSEAIRHFVREGGAYLGFCGGAGLATTDGIGLMGIRRKPTKERVPSFSGRIRLATTEHLLWQGIDDPVFHAWWPSQFIVDDSSVRVLASYANALPDSFSSDLAVGDTAENCSWQELEERYGINLDPHRMFGDPAVVEGGYGKGRVLLCLVHFDTPDDANGAVALRNLWSCFNLDKGSADKVTGANSPEREGRPSALIEEMESSVDELMALGMRNFLWFRKDRLLLQWRRGVRGLEYCTLYAMIKEISGCAPGRNIDESRLLHIRDLLVCFIDKAKRLLVLERHALQNGHITYERCDDPVITGIRTELFSGSKSHGGLFKELLDAVDSFLYPLFPEARK